MFFKDILKTLRRHAKQSTRLDGVIRETLEDGCRYHTHSLKYTSSMIT